MTELFGVFQCATTSVSIVMCHDHAKIFTLLWFSTVFPTFYINTPKRINKQTLSIVPEFLIFLASFFSNASTVGRFESYRILSVIPRTFLRQWARRKKERMTRRQIYLHRDLPLLGIIYTDDLISYTLDTPSLPSSRRFGKPKGMYRRLWKLATKSMQIKPIQAKGARTVFQEWISEWISLERKTKTLLVLLRNSCEVKRQWYGDSTIKLL